MNGKRAKRLRRIAETEPDELKGSRDYQVRVTASEVIEVPLVAAIDWGVKVPLRVITAVQRRNNPDSARGWYQKTKRRNAQGWRHAN